MVKVIVSARVLDKQVGGNTRYARELYSGLATSGVDYRAVRPPLESRGRGIAYAVFEGLYLPLHPPNDGDLLHFPADTGPIVPSSCPIVGTIHGLATLHVKNVRRRIPDKVWRRRVHRLAIVSSKIITVSESSARDIAKIEPGVASKIVVIPHGIDHDTFNAVQGSGDNEVRDELGIKGPYFLYVGNLDPRKNLVELCYAAARIFEITGIPLLLGGARAWQSKDSMEAAINARGVRYLGRVSEKALVPLIRGALAFCFPSKYEGFGFPVVEAMACGTPVICSDRGSLAEVAGDAALSISDIGRAAIASEMLHLVNDQSLRADLQRRGLKNAQRFQWKNSIGDHAQVFEDVAR